jgi:hypothetical protein
MAALAIAACDRKRRVFCGCKAGMKLPHWHHQATIAVRFSACTLKRFLLRRLGGFLAEVQLANISSENQ